jgi:hypothetical protein
VPSRIIREGINSSARINALSLGAEVLYRRLMSVADDYGRFYANPITVRGACWPTCPGRVSEDQVRGWLFDCSAGDHPLINIYQYDGCLYLVINNFQQQQRTKSKFPSPPLSPDISVRDVLGRPPREPDNGLISDCEQVENIPLENACTSRISDSESYSKSESETKPNSKAASLVLSISGKFQEFWELYPVHDGHQLCVQFWTNYVTPDVEAPLFESLRSYLASRRSKDSPKNPLTWLQDCRNEQWKASWPRAPEQSSTRAQIQRSELIAGLDAIDIMKGRKNGM